MLVIKFAFVLFCVCALIVWYLLYRSKDGLLRKRLMSFFLSLAWFSAGWAICYPPTDDYQKQVLMGLVTVLPVSICMLRLCVFLWSTYQNCNCHNGDCQCKK